MAYVLEEDTETVINEMAEFIGEIHPNIDTQEEALSVAIIHFANMLVIKSLGVENAVNYIRECRKLNKVETP